MKVFTDKSDYPYALGLYKSELEIVHQDISMGDFKKNNTHILFAKPLDFVNEIDGN
jgi:hypothetical protein